MTQSVNGQNGLQWVPHGQLATRQWLLRQRGVSVSAFDNALKSGKWKPLARGVVARPGPPLEWQGVVASLHRMSPEPVYVGGPSALAQQGLAHYVRFAENLHLYSPAREPNWLERLDLSVDWVWHRMARLWDLERLQAAGSLRAMPWHEGTWLLASPEQAWLEALQLLPNAVSFEQADQWMQGLVNLSPRRLDALLSACHHIKAKRLFFFFADRHRPAWRRHLNATDYDLGRGKRLVATGGKLDATYQITVPESQYEAG